VTGSFFEVAAAETELRCDRPSWFAPAEDVRPAVIAVDRELVRSDRAVVVLTDVRGYLNGLALRLAIWGRGEDDSRGDLPRGLFREGAVDEHTFRFGVEFADGRRATNLVVPRAADGEEPAGPVLMLHGGGGAYRQTEIDYWLWPLPPPGRMRVVCEWPAYGIAETSVELDATELVDAASRARPVWD
jgi:hypothetical protein